MMSNRTTAADPGRTRRSEWLLMLGSALTAVAIVCIVTFLLIREHANAQITASRSAGNLAQLIDADVLRNVELYDLTLQGLIAAAQRDDLKQVAPQIRHLVLFDRSTATRFKGDILLLDQYGEVVADSSALEPKPANHADRDYYLAHAFNRDTGMFISRPYKHRCDCDERDEWRISFSRRIQSSSGEFLGVAVASMRLAYFDQLFNSLNIGHGSTLNVISHEGILLGQKPHLENGSIGRDFSSRPNVVRILRQGSGTFSSVSSVDRAERLYTFSKVGNLPITVIVALSRDEIFATWQRTAAVVIGATGVLCVALLWLARLLSRELRLRRKAERELAQLAATDELTGVANRRTLDLTLRHEWFRALRSTQPLSLLMIDADRFKAFNDRYGHPQGDEALRRLARVIRETIRRPADLVARYGGEEFSVVLPETDADGAMNMAERIRLAVEHLPPLPSDAPPMTVSIGVSTWAGDPEANPERLLFNADRALYRAKEAGRNRVVAG